jgi:hypothetical protein
MVIHTYFDKNNTIVSNSNVNTGLNPITELFYGGELGNEQYSRFLFRFDETRLTSLYTGGTFTDLTKLKHTLRLTNTGCFDKDLLNGTMGTKDRACSFDLILFKVNQPWDNGVGYDYGVCGVLIGDCAFSNGASNWISAQTGINWSGGSGVYSGSPSGITVNTQHFDKGNENIEMDVTDYVNGVLTGDTNYGLGIAYARAFEQMSSLALQYVGFFTNNTQTFYEPYIETIYSNHIEDDRNNFFLDKPNKLYLYVNVAGNPTNLDSNPSVNVYDQDGGLFSAYSSTAITHVTLGVYAIDILVPTTSDNDCTMYNDVWGDVMIAGVSRADISLNFVIKNSSGYYNIGDSDTLPKKVAVSVSGLQNKEKIKRGDIRKVLVSARIPYTVEQTQVISGLKYRLYVAEGSSEYTVIDFQPVEMANNYYYFLIDTGSLIPNTYYLDVLVTSNLEVTTIKNVIQFDIVNQVELRKSQ